MCTHWVPREYESLTCVQPLSHFCLCVGKLWRGLMNTHAYAHRGRVRHASFWGLRMCVSFIMLELRSAGSYSTCQDWSPSPSQLLCFGPWRIQHLSWIFTGREREREQKKLHVYDLYKGAIKCYSCRRSQCSRCFTASCLGVGNNRSWLHL